MCVCGSVTTITRNCWFIDPHQTGFIGKGSDHLQLIKFWQFRAPGKWVCGRPKIFGSALLQPASSVCVSLSTFSFQLKPIVGVCCEVPVLLCCSETLNWLYLLSLQPSDNLIFIACFPVVSFFWLQGYWHQRAVERHGNPPPQGNQEQLVVRDKVGRPQVSFG